MSGNDDGAMRDAFTLTSNDQWLPAVLSFLDSLTLEERAWVLNHYCVACARRSEDPACLHAD